MYEQQCECELSTQPYSALPLSLLDFHSQQPGCENNKLSISQNGQTDTYCGGNNVPSTEIKVESNKVLLNFDTKGGSTGGFWMKFNGN